MNYNVQAESISKQDAVVSIKQSEIKFGTGPATADILPNPAELFLGSFASCILKNVERFSGMMKFSYTKATVDVKAVRLEHPPRMDNIDYELTIFTSDTKLNVDLLRKNIEKHGTIYNTVKLVCTITGSIHVSESN
jgi:uncharacterized OsmC-like protein